MIQILSRSTSHLTNITPHFMLKLPPSNLNTKLDFYSIHPANREAPETRQCKPWHSSGESSVAAALLRDSLLVSRYFLEL
jgi:hypothetical protein